MDRWGRMGLMVTRTYGWIGIVLLDGYMSSRMDGWNGARMDRWELGCMVE